MGYQRWQQKELLWPLTFSIRVLTSLVHSSVGALGGPSRFKQFKEVRTREGPASIRPGEREDIRMQVFAVRAKHGGQGGSGKTASSVKRQCRRQLVISEKLKWGHGDEFEIYSRCRDGVKRESRMIAFTCLKDYSGCFIISGSGGSRGAARRAGRSRCRRNSAPNLQGIGRRFPLL